MNRGEVFKIEGKTFFAFGGAMSTDKDPGWIEQPSSLSSWGRRVWNPGRKEGIDWWPEEVPSPEDYANALQNLDKVGWKVDHVLTHTCPSSVRPHFIRGTRAKDPTEAMLQEIANRLDFKAWHFGHFHCSEHVDRYYCHYNWVVPLRDHIEIR